MVYSTKRDHFSRLLTFLLLIEAFGVMLSEFPPSGICTKSLGFSKENGVFKGLLQIVVKLDCKCFRKMLYFSPHISLNKYFPVRLRSRLLVSGCPSCKIMFLLWKSRIYFRAGLSLIWLIFFFFFSETDPSLRYEVLSQIKIDASNKNAKPEPSESPKQSNMSACFLLLYIADSFILLNVLVSTRSHPATSYTAW